MRRPILQPIQATLGAALRLQQIGLVLATSGAGGTLLQLGLHVGKKGLSWRKGSSASASDLNAVLGRSLANALAQLGPTFIKLGQLLATRPDLVGEALATELQILFDRVPPVRFRIVRKLLLAEIGKQKFRDEFRSIQERPLASASLSQTHEAVLKDGRRVIVKLQKPGVARVVQQDLILLGGLAHSLALAFPHLGILAAFDEFRQATMREIDYREEAKNIERFKRNYSSFFANSSVVFPGYFPHLSTERLLVLEPMQGVKMASLQPGSLSAKRAAAESLQAIFEQIFDHGFFHADPHMGNLFYLEDSGRVGFIDLGLVGQLNLHDKRKFMKVLLAILQRDREKLSRALFDLGQPSGQTDFTAFDAGVQKLLDAVSRTKQTDLKIERLVNQLFSLARKNGIYIPNRYILMARTCLVIDGVARQLDPNVNVIQVAIPIVARSLAKTYSPFRWLSGR